jgi:hypothetical protein
MTVPRNLFLKEEYIYGPGLLDPFLFVHTAQHIQYMSQLTTSCVVRLRSSRACIWTSEVGGHAHGPRTQQASQDRYAWMGPSGEWTSFLLVRCGGLSLYWHEKTMTGNDNMHASLYPSRFAYSPFALVALTT